MKTKKEPSRFTEQSTLTACLFTFITVLFFAALFVFPKPATDGISKGIALFANIVLPSLFAPMVIASFINLTNISDTIAKIFPNSKVLPRKIIPTIILSLIGGYPMGAKLISNDLENGIISPKKASLMLCFCTNAGPSFIINAIGFRMLGNTSLGLTIFISNTLASITIAFFVMALSKNEKSNLQLTSQREKLPYSNAFVSAVHGSCIQMLYIAGFTSIFYCIFQIITESIPLNGQTITTIASVLEVSLGCNLLTYGKNAQLLPLIAAVTSFGGLCVWCQIASITKKSKINLKPFAISRFAAALLSALYCKIGLLLFPKVIQTSSLTPNLSGDNLFYYNPYISLLLFIMCVVFIIDSWIK